jgi:hypothetical protein
MMKNILQQTAITKGINNISTSPVIQSNTFETTNNDNSYLKFNGRDSLISDYSVKIAKGINKIKRNKSKSDSLLSHEESTITNDKYNKHLKSIQNDEIRAAEEAYAKNLKLVKKQKMKYIRLQRHLSRNIFLIPLCVMFSALSAAAIISTYITDNYQIITYDMDKLKYLIDETNNKSFIMVKEQSTTRIDIQQTSHMSIFKRFIIYLFKERNFNRKSSFNRVPNNYFYKLIFNKSDDYFSIEQSLIINNNYSIITKTDFYQQTLGIFSRCNYLSSLNLT